MKAKFPSESSFKSKKYPPKSKLQNNLSKTLSYVTNKSFTNEMKEKIVIEGQGNVTPIDIICKREGISEDTFFQWSQDFINNKFVPSDEIQPKDGVFSDDDKFRIVLEGNNGEFSIAEICRRENITHEKFLEWSNEFLQIKNKRISREKAKDAHTEKVKSLISRFVGKEILDYFECFIDVTSKETIVVRNGKKCFSKISFEGKNNLVCLSKVNDIRYINKHFELINSKLPLNGIMIGCLEPFTSREQRMNVYRIPVLGGIYSSFEFLLKRVIPKVSFTKSHYFNFTKGKDRLLSKAEVLGRLVSSGFRIMDYKLIEGLVYFVVKKVKEPVFDLNPSYGPLYRMPRIGKNGKIIKVFKFRTMHPYSEYLQDYILKANGYADSGKPAGDFRIPKWGKIMRKVWLDELPQLINVLKGDMKLVGIRPVSKRYFEDIPKEMQKLRLTQKPGCIPPYVALNRESNVMSVLQSEKEYMEACLKSPYTTDIKYFCSAVYNILIKHKRSA